SGHQGHHDPQPDDQPGDPQAPPEGRGVEDAGQPAGERQPTLVAAQLGPPPGEGQDDERRQQRDDRAGQRVLERQGQVLTASDPVGECAPGHRTSSCSSISPEWWVSSSNSPEMSATNSITPSSPGPTSAA